MKSQPKPDYVSNDEVQTPPELCEALAAHFKPRGRVLEPARGDGNFYRALGRYGATLEWCEINEGKDFLEFSGHVNWVITNPPFSQAKAFMQKAFQVSDNVVFLITLNHALGLKARFRLANEYSMGIREVIMLDTPPKPWPQAGFQLGAVHWQKNYEGTIQLTDWRARLETAAQQNAPPDR